MEGKSHSAWNSAGTWEERDVSKWAEGYLRAQLAALQVDGGAVTVTGVDRCAGEALITFPRGKKKMGYEFEIKLKIQAEVEGKTIKGTAELPYVCEDVDGHQYEVRYSMSGAGGAEAAVRRHLEATLTPALRQCIAAFSDQLACQ